MNNDQETVKRIGRALEASAERLTARGCTEEQIGRAMVATGLALWSRSTSLENVTSQLAGMALGLADATGQDLEEPNSAISNVR